MHSSASNMHRKPGFPVANCTIKMPDSSGALESGCEEDTEQQQRRQQLINFGHAQWGFNNWNWAVTKQELDFAEPSNGKYCAGVVAFVSVTVKSLDIHRENIGYATSSANTKGFAIYKSRKCAVTNALRETLLSFGGNVATELMDLLGTAPLIKDPAPEPENNQNIANIPTVANIPTEPRNSTLNLVKNVRKDSVESNNSVPIRPLAAPVKNAPVPPVNLSREPPVAKAHPMPACPPRPPPRPQAPRPNSNEPKVDPEEEARAERKRRQQRAQEEFRLKQLLKEGTDGKQETMKHSSFDTLLAEIPTQDIVIEETGDSLQAVAGAGAGAAGKRKSPAPETSAKRRGSVSRLDIVQTD